MMAPKLTPAEQANTMAALRFLRTRVGTWRLLAGALGLHACSVRNIKKGLKGVSLNVAFRVSRLAQVPFDDVVKGRWPAPGMCPHCGRGTADDHAASNREK